MYKHDPVNTSINKSNDSTQAHGEHMPDAFQMK